ncbi:MAG TPA: hypothetical protein VN436_06175, partial [Holophaga sp.]|nr:hypothetical protein [Holophaga sp.]
TVHGGEAELAPSTRKNLKLAAAGVAALLVVAGGFSIWNAKQRSQMAAVLEEAKKASAAKDSELQKLAQEQWMADQKAQQLAYQVKEAKDAQARADAQRALDQLQKDAEENKRKRDELLKQKQVLQQKNPSLTKTPTPSAPTSAPAAPGQDGPAAISKRVAPSIPHPGKSSLPPALQNSDINVSVKVFVDAQGRPLKVMIDKGVDGPYGYNEAAREAALASSYAPATKDGKAATGWVNLSYDFGKPQ